MLLHVFDVRHLKVFFKVAPLCEIQKDCNNCQMYIQQEKKEEKAESTPSDITVAL